MHLRLSTATRNGITHSYAQLVESYRRPDGVPAHRVVAHLGQLSTAEIENFKAALAANRQGRHVVVARAPARAPRRPTANLRYLDLAVLLALWRDSGLERLLSTLLPKGASDVAPADVVAALALERCIDPGSKLYAERWFPRTALPELLAIVPASFHNTRLHRVLDELDAVTPALMSQLPMLYLDKLRRPAFATLFLDVTDAMFVGHGPELAVRGKTKEGLIQRKIGIVLLCNELGYPLRWRVVAGNASDCTVMTDMFRALAQTRWAQQTPVVCDRAMGKTAILREIAETDLHFLTAVTTPEFETYAPQLPCAPFAALDVRSELSPEALASTVQQVREQAQVAGLARVNESLWVCDLGMTEVGTRAAADLELTSQAPAVGAARALQLCRTIEQAVAEGRFASFNAASRAAGVTPAAMKKYRLLGRLPQDVQETILSGETDRCSLAELVRVAHLADPAEQRTCLAALLESAAKHPPQRRSAPRCPSAAAPPQEAPFQVRVVAYFNPERFVEQRLTAHRRQAAIAAFVQELNERLANPRVRYDRACVLAAVDRRLRRDDMIEAYEVSVTEHDTGGRIHYQVGLKPITADWERRRRYHGFTVLAAHPALLCPAAELCQLYRAKDTVEKDFQVIKSVVKLRPIRHHTEAKVNAHVTLCMLALLLERILEHQLDGRSSAQAALETLATCHLNTYRGTGEGTVPVYSLTEPDKDQLALLRKLRLQLLAQDDDLAARITPRINAESENTEASS